MKRLLVLLAVVAGLSGYLYVINKAEGVADKESIVLNEDNTVILNLVINGQTVKNAQQELLEKSAKLSKRKPIYLILNSPGGSVEDGRQLIELASSLPQRVHTIQMFSASMSFIIGQHLDTRYVLDSSTLMSHRASVEGMAGTIPGSLNTRMSGLLSSLTELDERVASRAHMSLERYRGITANELWITGQQAVEMGFADKVVKVYCDKSLNGPAPEQAFDLGLVMIRVAFHKCPLITAPVSVGISSKSSSWEAKEQERAFLESIYNKKLYVRNHKYAGE